MPNAMDGVTLTVICGTIQHRERSIVTEETIDIGVGASIEPSKSLFYKR